MPKPLPKPVQYVIFQSFNSKTGLYGYMFKIQPYSLDAIYAEHKNEPWICFKGIDLNECLQHWFYDVIAKSNQLNDMSFNDVLVNWISSTFLKDKGKHAVEDQK